MKRNRIMSFLLAGTLMVGLTACGQGAKDDKSQYIAKVNGKEITYGEYEKNFMIFKKQIESNVGTDIWSQDAGEGKTYRVVFREQILEKLIEDELIVQEAEKEKITVDEKEVDDQLANFKKQIESNKDYKEYLTKNNIDDAFLRNKMKMDSLLRDFKLAFEKQHPISEEDLSKYYDENLEQFRINEVRASHILIKTVDDNRVPLPEKEKAEAKVKAQAILDKIKAGEDFATLAKENSEDPGSGANGGDLGFFPKGQMVKPFEEAAFSMKVGDLSDLVESDYGYHIIKVTDKKDETSTFAEVKDRIKTILTDKAYQDYISELKSKAKIEKNEELLTKEDGKEEKEEKK